MKIKDLPNFPKFKDILERLSWKLCMLCDMDAPHKQDISAINSAFEEVGNIEVPVPSKLLATFLIDNRIVWNSEEWNLIRMKWSELEEEFGKLLHNLIINNNTKKDLEDYGSELSGDK